MKASPKILLIRFSSIGDIVLTSPVIRCIKKKYPESEIHFVTKKAFAAVVKSNPYITCTHEFNGELWPLIKQLRAEKFDYIIDLHNNLRSFFIKRFVSGKSSAFYKANTAKWLMTMFKINQLPQTHIVERYLQAAEHLQVTNDGEGLDYFIDEKDEVDVRAKFSVMPNEYCAFVIGAKHRTKQLPAEKIIATLKNIKTKVVLLGGHDDENLAAQIMRVDYSHVINAVGGLNLNQSASVIKQAKNVISHDTGLMHIAAAFKKEIVSVWGNTIPAFGMAPYYGKNAVRNFQAEVKNLACRPCSKIGYSACPKKHFKCMNEQDGKAIAHFVNE